YTDAPGVAAAQKVLVNDLDLTVVDASGRTYYPNNGSGKDSTNNMEQVDLNSAPSGTYTVTVTGASVPQGKNGAQPFALVISSGK
ncbi:MAG: S8 family serine peptidase, partial [Bdellovibrionota bacterium]